MRPNEQVEPAAETPKKKKEKIGKDEIRRAAAILKDYAAHKKSLDVRISENERWFRLRHWDRR